MADNRRYFYLKVKDSFYNSETIVVLESMQDGLIYSNLLMKMYLMSLKNSGVLMLNDHIPHTPQTIATFTRHQIGTVERALKVFMELGLVEVLTDGTYYMTDIQMLIGLSSTEGERKKRERMRLQQENLLPQNVVDICPPIDAVDKCPPILELEIEKELELKTERELETGQTTFAPLGRYNNVFLSEAELTALQTDLPTKWQHYIDRLSEYMASTGKKYQSHLATIRRWAAADGKQTTNIPNYTYEEGESL